MTLRHCQIWRRLPGKRWERFGAAGELNVIQEMVTEFNQQSIATGDRWEYTLYTLGVDPNDA